jgi:hypothetical protein
MHRTILAALAAILPALAGAQAKQPTFEVFGFAQVDYIQDFDRVNPDWNAMLRASKVPTVDGQYGPDGEAILSARQSRLGVKGTFPSGKYDLKARIEFDFFGTGGGSPDSAGQSSIRLRRAYGEWGPILGGLTDSLFMDDDYWPNIVEYWGPTGMVFFRNVQLRYTAPLAGPHSLAVAIERPGSDLQAYPEQLPNLSSHNELPDLTARYRFAQKWGYVQLSGIVRRLGWDNGLPGAAHRTGNVTGWGVNASSTIKIVPDKVHLLPAIVYGEGVSNYMNDSTPDVGAGGTLADPKGEAVPLLGVSVYVDVYWNKLVTSSFGYSTVNLDNTSLQPGSAYQRGEYASANALFHPAPNFLIGPELQWAQRTDNDGAGGQDVRVQVSAKWAFSTSKDFWK